jgi:hypothetical protein
MPCGLTVSTTFDCDFIGEVGSEITLTVNGPQDTGAKILHIRYAGEEIDATAPFQFTVQEGLKLLIVLAESSAAGSPLRLIEDCGNTEQVLRNFFYDPQSPARGYIVKGEAA